MSKTFSIDQTAEGDLRIKSGQDIILFKAAREEIWKNEILFASYEALEGITVNEVRELYQMEMRFSEDQKLIITEPISGDKMKMLVQKVWDYLGLEM